MAHEICGFENLHCHTSIGSLLDGLALPEEYAQRAKKNNSKFLCISDHGMLSAIPAQIKTCEANNLSPNFAIEFYVNPLQIAYKNQDEFKVYTKDLSPEEQKKLRKSYHLLGIAFNEIGYANLVKLSSLAWTNGFYYRPRVNHEQLLMYKEGITFTSCCYNSEIGQAFDKGGEEAGFAMIEKYMAMFGENFYLEFMLLDFSKQRPYNIFIMKAHDKYKIPLIISCDSHYANPEDSKYQRYMLMVQTKRTVKEIEQKIQEAGEQDLFELQDTNLWLKSEDELNDKWDKDYRDVVDYDLFKQAKRNTVEIARKSASVKLDRSIKLPIFPNANEVLKEEVIKGFKYRCLPKNNDYSNRIKEELGLMFRKNFSSYFLMLKKTIDEAKRYGREVLGTSNVLGFGRGSGVGSLVCYCLGVTNVDPIKHDLLFSRFLSAARDDYPDVDCDFESDVTREHLREWVVEEFGRDYVASIGSFNTYGLKSALLDMARIFDKDRNEVLALTKKLDMKDDDGRVLTWDKALEEYPDLNKYCADNPEVAEAAKKLIHRNKSAGQHAAGIIVSNKPINNFIPLMKTRKGDFVTSWTEGLHYQDLSPMGFIKMDWLVITNLQQVNYACKLIKERHGLTSICAKDGQEDWSDDSFINDPKALELAKVADLKGIFQFDSDGILNLARKMKADSFADLVALTSIFRPGPMMCLEKNTLVYTNNGHKKIKDVEVGTDKIKYVNKFGHIKDTSLFLKSNKKNRNILKITLKNGKFIFCSKGHKFLSENNIFVKAKDLIKNSKIYHSSSL